MSSLSVTAAPFLYSGTRSVGVLPSQGGVHTTRPDGHRVSWSMSGERPLQFTANPRLLETAATPRLLQPIATPRPLQPHATPQHQATPEPLATPKPQAMANLQPAASYLLGQQVPPINKFSGNDVDGEGDTFLE